MKAAVLTFLVLLIGFHCLDGGKANLDRPLSMFRDDGLGAFGYPLFAALLLIGVVMVTTAIRRKYFCDAAVFASGSLLLLAVALTPSLDDFHITCSVLLLLLFYVYYAILLAFFGGCWMCVHLPLPIALSLVVGLYSYGLWQKGMIVYFVLAAVIHHHILTRSGPAYSSRSSPRTAPGVEFGKRRRVYTLEPDKAWARRRPVLDPS